MRPYARPSPNQCHRYVQLPRILRSRPHANPVRANTDFGFSKSTKHTKSSKSSRPSRSYDVCQVLKSVSCLPLSSVI